jgi:hypothetical protein
LDTAKFADFVTFRQPDDIAIVRRFPSKTPRWAAALEDKSVDNLNASVQGLPAA